MKRTLGFVLSLALTGGALAAGNLTYGLGGEPVNLDAGDTTDGNAVLVMQQIYDTLLRFKPGTSTLLPALATKWSSNKDATAWTFLLRQRVKFQDGTPFNADAVIFNVNRWWDPQNAYGYRDQGKTWTAWSTTFGAYKGQPGNLLKEVRRDNDHQVTFVLNRPFGDFPQAMGTTVFGFASPTAVKAQGAKYGTPASTPVGTGPFAYVGWKTGDSIKLKPNRSYWGVASTLDGLSIRFIKDASARLNELRTGGIDFTTDLNPDDLKAIQADQNLKVVPSSSFNTGYLSLNVRNKFLANDKVRQAISMAINKKALVSAFWGDLGRSDASLLPPLFKWANSKKVPADYTYDPAAAKKLLADAGYPNGFSIDLWYMPVSRPYFPTPKPIAEGLAADLNAIGIRVNLKTEDWGKYLEDRNKEPGFDMYMIGVIGNYASPAAFYIGTSRYGEAGTVDIGYKNPKLNALLQQATVTTDRAVQAGLYQQVHDITYAANVRLPIVHSNPLAAARANVTNWVADPISESFNTIRVGK